MNSACSKKDFVRAFDPDFTDEEHIYAWDRDQPMIRPNALICPGCNHALPPPNKNGKPNCEDQNCEHCGWPVKLYGYNNLYYDKTTDDADYDDADVYDMNIQQPDDAVYMGRMKRSSKSKRHPKTMNKESTESMDHVEHMDGTGYPIMSIIIFLLLFIITLVIAGLRKELYNSDEKDNSRFFPEKGINWSLVICIFFFMQFYWVYVLVDWITLPCHDCV